MSGTAAEIPQSVIDYQLSHASDTRAPGLYAFYIIMLTASIVVVVARFASRRVGPGLGPDDWCIGLALIFLCGVFVCNFMYLAAGLGKHQLTVSKSQQALGAKVRPRFPHFHTPIACPYKIRQIGFPANILYTITWPLIKISILLLYRRIFFANRRFTQFVDVMLGVMACYIISTVLVDIFGCHPVDKSWHPLKDGHCIDSIKLFKATAALNVSFDGIILLMPMPLVWRLQTSLKIKLAVTFIFALGALTMVTSIIRITTFDQIDPLDGDWSYVDSDYWTAAELCLSVICACLPTIRPLWTSTRSFIRSRSNRSKDQTPTSQALSDKPPNGENAARSIPMRKQSSKDAVTTMAAARSPSRYTSPTREGFEKISEREKGFGYYEQGNPGQHTRREDYERAREDHEV